MKIAISATGKELNSLLDSRFGRCEYFQIHDSENDKYNIIENEGLTSSGGAGIVAAQQLIDEGVDIVITGSLGPNAYNIIKKAKIKSFKCENIEIEHVLEKFYDNKLEEIVSAGESHKGMSN